MNNNKNKTKNVSFRVQNTDRYGKGVFAHTSIPARTVIHILDGQRMTLGNLVQRVRAGKEYIDDPFQIGRRTYIDLDELSRTFNHSCKPSAGIRKTSELFALRDIDPGEEITYDYSLTIAPTTWSMRCRCGAKNCRKIIGDVRTIPAKQMKYYKQHGAVQRYMKKIITQLESGSYVIPQYELNALKLLNQH